MSDSPALAWFKTLAGAGVLTLVGSGIRRLWRAAVDAPLRAERARATRADRDAEYWRAKYFEIAAELKENTKALLDVKRARDLAAGAPPESLPPPRGELPTLACFVEGPAAREAARAMAEEHERARAAPLNPSPPDRRRPPPLEGVRVIETYSPSAMPTLPAPPGTEANPVALAPRFPPPPGAPGGPPRPASRGRTR